VWQQVSDFVRNGCSPQGDQADIGQLQPVMAPKCPPLTRRARPAAAADEATAWASCRRPADGVGWRVDLAHELEEHMPSASLLARVDHLVYATAELDRGVAEIERLLGVRASAGGRHPTWATRNALAALGPRCYLEIIAPDPDQPPSAAARPFGLDGHAPSRLIGWAAAAADLGQLRAAATQHGVALGEMLAGSRQRPDGTILKWTLTDPSCVVADGIVPFFIDWGASPHPAASATAGATLVSLRAEHPNAEQVREILRVFGLPMSVVTASAPALVAVIDGPKGRVVLR
jgi:hypothetical protein